MLTLLSFGTNILTILIVLIVLAVLLVGWIIGVYNKMVRGKNLVEESWNQIDVELNRRYDLIPNLVNTIKGATAHEKETLESVIGLRNQAAALAGSNASPAQRAQVEEQLTSQLQNLVNVTVEKYPELRANENFLKLQSELSEIESRIANSRKYYNANVGSFNTLIESFPNSLIAGGRFKKAQYFQIQDPGIRQNPVVDFSPSAAPATAPVVETAAGVLETPALGETLSGEVALETPAIPTQVADPFPDTPAPAGDYAQPDFSQSSKVKDK